MDAATLFPEKPAYGTPCNGCGLCCQNEICPLGAVVFPRAQAPCPALEKNGERFDCGLIAHPEKYAPVKASVHGAEAMRAAAQTGIGAGVGCDARVPGEDEPPAEYLAAMARLSRTPEYKRAKIKRLWTA